MAIEVAKVFGRGKPTARNNKIGESRRPPEK
jgi:hypothetical protein